MNIPSHKDNNRLKDEVKSQLTKEKSEVLLKDLSEEMSEKTETDQQSGLQKKKEEPKQITLKDGNHGQKVRLRCEEEVKSLLTIKNEVSSKETDQQDQKIPKKKLTNNWIFRK